MCRAEGQGANCGSFTTQTTPKKVLAAVKITRCVLLEGFAGQKVDDAACFVGLLLRGAGRPVLRELSRARQQSNAASSRLCWYRLPLLAGIVRDPDFDPYAVDFGAISRKRFRPLP